MFYNNLPKRTNNHLHNLYKSEEELGAEALTKAEETDLILKGRKGEPIGTRKKWGNQEYIKTAQGWKADKGTIAAHDKIHGEAKKEDDHHAQSQSFEHNGYTVQRHSQSATQGTFTVHKDGKQIGGHYSDQAPYSKEHMVHSANDGRKDTWRATDKEIKDSVDKIHSKETKKNEIRELLKNTTFGSGLTEDIADYFSSPAFPDLKSIKEFKGNSVQETKENLEKLSAFKGGRFAYTHAKTIAEALHGKEQSDKKDIEEFSKMYRQSMGKTIPAPKGISDHAITAYNDVAGGMSSEEFYKKHKVGDYDSYKETATKNGNAKMERAEAKPAEPAKPAFNADEVSKHLKGLTASNNHGEALQHLAKTLGHKEAEEKLTAINKQHQKQGYLSMDQSHERYGVYQDLLKHVKEHHGDEAHKKIYGSL